MFAAVKITFVQQHLRRCSRFLLHCLQVVLLLYMAACIDEDVGVLFGLPVAGDYAVQTKAFSIFAKAGSLAALLCVFANFLHIHQTRRHSQPD